MTDSAVACNLVLFLREVRLGKDLLVDEALVAVHLFGLLKKVFKHLTRDAKRTRLRIAL